MKQATDAHAHLREMASAIQSTFQGSYEGNQIMHVNIPHVSDPESLPSIMSNTCCHHQAFFVQYGSELIIQILWVENTGHRRRATGWFCKYE